MRYWGLLGFLYDLPEIWEHRGLPRGCWHCEVLGMCRYRKENGWWGKCRNGCLVLNWAKEREFEGLPRGCWHCEYLKECRRPKEEGWKCYNGCRKIEEKKRQGKV